MINILSIISPFLSLAMIVSFVLLVIFFSIAFLFSVFNKGPAIRKTFISISLIPGLIFISVLMFSNLMDFFVIQKLDRLLVSPTSKVEIDGFYVLNSEQLKKQFMQRTKTKASGSSPGETLRVKIIDDGQSLILDFRVDSRNHGLFWVYFPGFKNRGSLFYVNTTLLSAFSESGSSD